MSSCLQKVWKAYLDESPIFGPPSYLVAAKTVAGKNASAAASQELRDEANVMARLASHPNVLAVVGIITVGYPLVLVMSYCEHGSLLSYLKKNVKDGKPIAYHVKLQLGVDIACGMEHLATRSFIHRDLACRNVLVSSERVGIIADFGLSRGGATSVGAAAAGDESVDAAPEYYRSKTGIAPVRWTAPEALQHNRFSIASDVWSYGIVLAEIMQDGTRPYGQWLDVDKVAYKVKEGHIHEQPEGCPDDLYQTMSTCWSFKAIERPSFPSLAKSITQLLDRERNGNAIKAGVAAAIPDYILVGEHEEIYKQKLYARLSSDVADGVDDVTASNLYSRLEETPLVSLREAAKVAEVHCGCSLQEEVDLALSFAKRLFAQPRAKKYLRDLTINDIATFHLYTQETELYKKLNSTLGGWGDSDPKAILHYLPFVRLLVSAMDKLEAISCVAYRGIRLSVSLALGNRKVGDFLTWGAFTSSTLSPDVLRDPQFLGIGAGLGERVVFVIQILTGVKIHFFSDKGSAAEYFLSGKANVSGNGDGGSGGGNVFAENEEEVLLRPCTIFQIDAIIKRDHGITEVKMHEVLAGEGDRVAPRRSSAESIVDSLVNETPSSKHKVPSGASIKIKSPGGVAISPVAMADSEYSTITEDFEEEEVVENIYVQPVSSTESAAATAHVDAVAIDAKTKKDAAAAARAAAAAAAQLPEEAPLPPPRLPMERTVEESAC